MFAWVIVLVVFLFCISYETNLALCLQDFNKVTYLTCGFKTRHRPITKKHSTHLYSSFVSLNNVDGCRSMQVARWNLRENNGKHRSLLQFTPFRNRSLNSALLAASIYLTNPLFTCNFVDQRTIQGVSTVVQDNVCEPRFPLLSACCVELAPEDSRR